MKNVNHQFLILMEDVVHKTVRSLYKIFSFIYLVLFFLIVYQVMEDKTAIIIIYTSTFMEINLESFDAEETP